uniref:MoaB/Mog domain-containing protein n=1 Tax=Ditylenchus dipsaci TaxID=166011 RepID=A0A915CVL3_9BILA
MRVSVITVSDSCSKDRSLDKKVVDFLVVPDEFDQIRNVLKECASKSDVVVTTGGTARMFGIATAILMKGLEKTPMAALSRLTAGTVGRCLIVNLPGSQKAVKEGFEIIEILIPHAVLLLHENVSQVKEDHKEIQK